MTNLVEEKYKVSHRKIWFKYSIHHPDKSREKMEVVNA